MTESSEPQDGRQPSPRGEEAWKAHKALIAERNEKAKKAGKQERREHEQRVELQRREAGR